MHVLVTGHTGFKGAWLTAMLRAEGHEVSGISLDPVPGSLYERARLTEVLRHDLRVDIRDAAGSRDALRRVAPDVVMHLAAQALVRESYREPRRTWETNVLGTLNVLEAVQEVGGVAAVLVVTTDKVYRNTGRVQGYVETDPLGGEDPYSASKAAADLAARSWAMSSGCGVPMAIARAGNVIGGGDMCAERLMVDVLAALEADRPVTLRNPGAVRPWQHVLDCLAGYWALTSALLRGEQHGEAFNFGPEPDAVADVRTVVEQTARLWGGPVRVEHQAPSTMREEQVLTLDSSRAARRLDWRPRLALDDALGLTVAWHREVGCGRDPREVTDDQIRGFVALSARPVAAHV